MNNLVFLSSHLLGSLVKKVVLVIGHCADFECHIQTSIYGEENKGRKLENIHNVLGSCRIQDLLHFVRNYAQTSLLF